MTKGTNQKLKMLYLKQIFEEETDDQHSLTLQNITERLNSLGVNADRKTLYQDFKELKRYGMDIIAMQEGRTWNYHLGSRDFELPEVKLLVDSVQASKFINEHKSDTLIRKLEKLVSHYEGQELQRQVYIFGRIKTSNKRTYLTIDTIFKAINENYQIQFHYCKWNIHKELEKRRAQEDQLLQQILREQQMLQELDEDMDQNMAHAKEGRRYREDMKARVDDRVYEMHDLSADKREGMREYGYAYRRGYALAMVFFSLALCVFAGYLHGIASQTCLVLMFFTGVQAAILVHKKQCPKFWQFVCDVFSALIFPGMLILFIGCELHYSYYERALPYCLAVGLFLLALTTASYFLYDPYRSARRRVGDAKSMIRSIERSAKKQVKKNQKQQAKEELRQDRLQKKESEKLLKIQQKQEVRLEKQGKRLQKWETWKQQFLERFQKSEDIVDEEVSDETLPDAAAGDETLPEEAVVDEALRKDTVVDEALPKETVGNEALPAESGEEDPDDPHI